MDKLLITGVETVVGSNLLVALANRYEVLGVTANSLVEIDACPIARCESSRLPDLVQRHAPQWVIHCGPYSASAWDLPTDRVEPGEVQVVRELGQACDEVQARLMLISTDAVLDCPGIFHDETSILMATHPAAAVARQVEAAVSKTSGLVVRTHAYGISPLDQHTGFAQFTYDGLQAGMPPLASASRYASPILTSDLAELLVAAYEHGLTGLYHMAGAERTHMDRFATELASLALSDAPRYEVFSDTVNRGRGERQETSLNSRLARRALQLPMPLLREGLQRFVAQAEMMQKRLRGNRSYLARAAA